MQEQIFFQTIETNGVHLRTVVEGEGPLLILLHGFPQCWYLWRHQIDPLVEAGFKVAVPDQRGYGGSDAPKRVEAYDLVNLAGDVFGIAETLGYEEFIVIGHDLGAKVAWHTALLYPENCKSVVGLSVPYLRDSEPKLRIDPPGLENSFWYQRYFQEPGVAEEELEADIEKSLLAIYYTLSADTPDGTWMAQTAKPKDSAMIDALVIPESLPNWLTREDLNYYVEQFKKSGFRGALNWYRNIVRNTEIAPQLETAKIKQPAYFIAGSKDDVLKHIPGRIDLMDNWFEDLRGKTLIVGAGHWVQLEQPEKTTQVLIEFLNRVR